MRKKRALMAGFNWINSMAERISEIRDPESLERRTLQLIRHYLDRHPKKAQNELHWISHDIFRDMTTHLGTSYEETIERVFAKWTAKRLDGE